jgi:hypothetical protein
MKLHALLKKTATVVAAPREREWRDNSRGRVPATRHRS